MGRYRVATFLFGILYVLLMGRWLRWPNLPREVILSLWFLLSTPAMVLLIINLYQETRQVYHGRRRIDRLLDDQQQDSVP